MWLLGPSNTHFMNAEFNRTLTTSRKLLSNLSPAEVQSWDRVLQVPGVLQARWLIHVELLWFSSSSCILTISAFTLVSQHALWLSSRMLCVSSKKAEELWDLCSVWTRIQWHKLFSGSKDFSEVQLPLDNSASAGVLKLILLRCTL